MSEFAKVATFGRITKVNAATQTVEGIGADETPDTDGEIFDYDGSKPYIEAWSAKQADTTKSAGQQVSYGNIRGQHDAKVAAGRVAEPIHFDDTKKEVFLSTKIVDKDEFQKCLEGVYTGFSVKGRAVKKWRDGKHARYIVDPVEFSLVDVPCNPGATFTAVKADGSTEEREFQHVEKKKFSAEDRKKLADEGKAMPDGSFPIESRKDVEDAVHDFGRSGSKPEVKRHIIRRAKALGATDALPADWTGSTKKSADGDVIEIDGIRRFADEGLDDFVERAVSTLVSKAAEPPKPAAQEKSMLTEQEKEVQKAAAVEKMKAARKAHSDVGACVGGYCDHGDATKCMEKADEAHKHIAAAFQDDEKAAEKSSKSEEKKSEEKKDAKDGDSEEEKKKKAAKKAEDDEKDKEKEKAAGSELAELRTQVANLTALVEKMAAQPGTERAKPVVTGTVVTKAADAGKGEQQDKAADIDPSDPNRVEKSIGKIYKGELETVAL